MELDSEKLLDLLATSGQQIEGNLREELVALATSLLAAAKDLNERVMATGTYSSHPPALP